MRPDIDEDRVAVYHGDSLEVLSGLPDASVDAVVTDPPYGLEFMGKEWDRPWAVSASNGVGYSGRDDLKLPAHRDSRNANCRACGGRQRGAKRCTCDTPKWDRNPADDMREFQAWAEMWAVECLRVLKPGGHILAFGGTRTWHRLACAIEDAGFEVRDSIAWLYGSGFPKSLDVSKAIDKRGGAVAGFEAFRDAVRDAMRRNGVSRATLTAALGNHMLSHYLTAGSQPAVPNAKDYRIIRDTVGLGNDWDHLFAEEAEREVIGTKTSGIANKDEGPRHTIGASKAVLVDVTAPATPDAARWQGWGTALKPAFEPVVVARKPLTGTVAANVLEHGVGGLNIDGCRVATDDKLQSLDGSFSFAGSGGANETGKTIVKRDAGLGRWPANVVLDEDQAEVLDGQSGVTKSITGLQPALGRSGGILGQAKPRPDAGNPMGYSDSGGASRFFYVAKAPAKERPKVDGVAHPTVKPLTLMRWLCRLVTPPNGLILEPFAGSGTTVEAALREGFRVIAIEREADYLPLIQARLDRVKEGDDGQLTFDTPA